MEETSRSEHEDHAFPCVEIIWRRPVGVSLFWNSTRNLVESLGSHALSARDRMLPALEWFMRNDGINLIN